MKRQVWALALATSAGTAASVCAVEKGNGAAPAASGLNYVGKHQGEDTQSGLAQCTATHISNGVVLLAAHCLDSTSSSRYRGFNRFELNGQRPALGIVRPGWGRAVGEGNNDIALLLVLNGQNDNASGRAILAANADDVNLEANINANGPNIQLVGWQSADDTTSGTATPLSGVTRLVGSPAGEWRYDRTVVAGGGFTGSNWINRGDSGGPSFFNFGGMTGTKLMGVHSFRDDRVPANATRDVDTRVSPHLDFIDGKGVGGEAVFVRVAGVGARDWDTAADWSRAVAPAASTPKDGDVVILDPTSAGNAGDTIMTLSTAGATRNLLGLLTDVKLRVSNAAVLKVTGSSGAVNGGELAASGTGTRVEVGHQFYNAGDLSATARAVVAVGEAAPATVTDNVFVNDTDPAVATTFESVLMFNDRSARIDVTAGGKLTTPAQLKNYGRMEVRGADSAIEAGAALPATVGTMAMPRASVGLLNTTAAAGTGGAGTARVVVGPGGTLTVRNPSKTVVTRNGQDGTIDVAGGMFQTAQFNGSVLDNAGALSVGTLGRVEIQTGTTNQERGRISVTGGGVFISAAIVNKTGGGFGGGSISVAGPSFALAKGDGATAALVNERGASVNLDPGSELGVEGRFSNAGDVVMRSNHDDGRSILRVTRDASLSRGKLVNTRRMDFGLNLDPMLLPVNKPEIILEDSDFVNDDAQARLKGDLKWTIKGHSHWSNKVNDVVDIALSRYTAFDMVWDAATAGVNTPVTMETLSKKPALMPMQLPPLSVLDESLSLRTMCLTNGSMVKLVGDFDNEGAKATEVLFVRFLGISANSMLKTNGFTLYYLDPDPMCGLDLTRIDRTGGGDVVRLPTPGAAMLLALAGLGAARRRR